MDDSPTYVDSERRSGGFGDSRAELLAATEELANTGGWELDVRTQTLHWTDGTRRIHEVGAEYEPTLESALSYYHPDDRPTMAVAVERAIEHGESYDETVRLVTATETERWVHVRGEAVEENGQTVRVYGALRDITDRRETEARLRERKAHLRNAQAVADVGSWIRDVPDNEIWWSDEVYNIFGLSRADGPIDHDEFMSFIHPADRERMAAAWTAALEGDSFDIEHRIVVDGETKWVREKAEMEFDADGQPQQAIGVVQDVTERKAYEQQLEAQNEQLAVLNRIMRHDLRNKMSIILGYAEELDERFDGEPSVLADRLRDGAEELLAISEEVHDLRDLFEADPKPRSLALDPLVAEAVEQVRREHPEASYSTTVPDGLRVQAVPALQVALTNVVENAVVHNDSAQPEVAVRAAETDGTVTVAVTDDGPGIPEAEYEHLTGTRERTQLDHTSGLGLWAVRWIVSNCDGTVQFETAGDGTTVRIRLHRAASST